MGYQYGGGVFFVGFLQFQVEMWVVQVVLVEVFGQCIQVFVFVCIVQVVYVYWYEIDQCFEQVVVIMVCVVFDGIECGGVGQQQFFQCKVFDVGFVGGWYQ